MSRYCRLFNYKDNGVDSHSVLGWREISRQKEECKKKNAVIIFASVKRLCKLYLTRKEKITTFLSNLWRKSLQKRIKSFY